MKAKKAKIERVRHGVCLTYDDPISQERIDRFFSCPEEGGYVYEIDEKGLAQMVGPHLSSSGDGLISASKERLIKTIRREWAGYRRWLKKEELS